MKHTTLDIEFREALEEAEITFDQFEDDSFLIAGPFQKVLVFINEDSEFEMETVEVGMQFTNRYENFDFEQEIAPVIEYVKSIENEVQG